MRLGVAPSVPPHSRCVPSPHHLCPPPRPQTCHPFSFPAPSFSLPLLLYCCDILDASHPKSTYPFHPHHIYYLLSSQLTRFPPKLFLCLSLNPCQHHSRDRPTRVHTLSPRRHRGHPCGCCHCQDCPAAEASVVGGGRGQGEKEGWLFEQVGG